MGGKSWATLLSGLFFVSFAVLYCFIPLMTDIKVYDTPRQIYMGCVGLGAGVALWWGL